MVSKMRNGDKDFMANFRYKCANCGKKLNSYFDECPYCDCKDLIKYKVKKKNSHTAIKVLTILVVIVLVLLLIWKIKFPYVFYSNEMLLGKGLYEEAWKKAESEPLTQESILKENIVAFACKDCKDRLLDPSSFKLVNAEFFYRSNYSLVLTFRADNKMGNSILAQWEYDYNLDSNEELYGLQYDYIDLTRNSNDDREKTNEKIFRSLSAISYYPTMYTSIGSEAISRINSLSDAGGLDNVTLINAAKSDIWDMRNKNNAKANN